MHPLKDLLTTIHVRVLKHPGAFLIPETRISFERKIIIHCNQDQIDKEIREIKMNVFK